MFIPPWYRQPIVQLVLEPTIKLSYKKLQYPTYVTDTNLNVHNKVFKKAIKANGETMETDIINLFGFTLLNNILEWGENFVQDHSNCTFEELEQAFYKCFQIVNNDEEIYMQLRNLQQQVGEWAHDNFIATNKGQVYQVFYSLFGKDVVIAMNLLV